MITRPRFILYFPNALANLLVISISLGVSQLHLIRNGFIVLTVLLFVLFIRQLKLNNFVFSTYFLFLLNIYFAIGAFIFHSPSSLWLFKNFGYLIIFDLFIKYRMKNTKSVFYITIIMAFLTLTLNQLFQKGIIGTFSPAFGISRILSVSTVIILLFLLFNYTKWYHKIFILFSILISFSLANFIIYILYFVKKIPIIFITVSAVFLLTINFEENELYQLVKTQKEMSIENKMNDIKVLSSEYDEYEIAEVLSVELYQNSGFFFSIIVTAFLIFYIYSISRSWTFTTFSMIMISSNPTPLIFIFILANLLNISNNENKEYS